MDTGKIFTLNCGGWRSENHDTPKKYGPRTQKIWPQLQQMSDEKTETYYVPQKFIPRGHCLHCGETYMAHDNLEDLCLKIKELQAELSTIKEVIEDCGKIREAWNKSAVPGMPKEYLLLASDTFLSMLRK